MYLLNPIVNIPTHDVTAITQDDHRSKLELGPPVVVNVDVITAFFFLELSLYYSK